jgi:putative toxin-antitoxin system antitoxin component (TIGR02293 family)
MLMSKDKDSKDPEMNARIAQIEGLAAEVFGNSYKSARWLDTPNCAINGQLPIALLQTTRGAKIVETILGRIAHGIFS